MRITTKFRYAGAAGVLLLGLGASRAGAGVVAYGFAEQTISGVTISATNGGATLTVTTPLSTGTGDAASANGPGVSNTDKVDALEAYIGTPPPAPQNDFSKYATFAGTSPLAAGSLPTGLTGGSALDNFTRGDVLISGLGTTSASASNVSESYLNSATGGLTAYGSSTYSATLSFSTSATTSLNLSYNYLNDLYAATAGGGQAQANYKFDVTLKNQAGATVFDVSSPNANLSSASPPNGVEISRTGTDTFLNLGTLTSGQNYTLTFSGSSATFVSATALVPEPSTLLGAGFAVVAAGLAARMRRKTA